VSRRGYATALAVAVAVLLGSMGLTAVALVAHGLDRGVARGVGIYGGNGWGSGMMGQAKPGQAQEGLAAAQKFATDWLAANQPGAQLGAGGTMPMGFVFTVTRNGTPVGMLVVRRGGQVSYREFQPASPTPTPSASSTA
jgi:hypothetical protein